ncbi:MAG: AMP-binding protein, partial [Planctomycetes bacterium]|nr:AMP-binding protein [Planctomycetota bacterium]
MNNINTIRDLYLAYLNDKRPLSVIQIYTENNIVTYNKSDLISLVSSVISYLDNKGVSEKDHVAVCMYNSFELLAIDCACFLKGVVVVPIHSNLSPSQISFILKDSDSKFFITDLPADTVAELNVIVLSKKEIISNWKEDVPLQTIDRRVITGDLALIMYTSGTTGVSKGVMLTHENIISNVIASSKALAISHEDLLFSFLPFSHIFERIVDYIAILDSATIAYPESVHTVQRDLKIVKPTVVAAVPRFFEKISENIYVKLSPLPLIIKRSFDKLINSERLNVFESILNKFIVRRVRKELGGRIKFFVSGGAALSAHLQNFFWKIGILILQGYGLTEASPVVSVNRIEKFKFGTCGPPIEGVEVKTADDGELLVRGPNVMKGYYKRPEDTSQIIIDGWLYTGDIVSIDQDGFISIVDRKKDLFKTSTGKYVAPTPLESQLKNFPGIREAVIIGNNRKFVSALLFTDRDLSELHDHIDAGINELNSSLSLSEQIKKYKIMREEVPATLYTPTLKLKRR